jgi:hypothetical protein
MLARHMASTNLLVVMQQALNQCLSIDLWYWPGSQCATNYTHLYRFRCDLTIREFEISRTRCRKHLRMD